MAGLCCAALSLAVASQQPCVRNVAACRPHHSILELAGKAPYHAQPLHHSLRCPSWVLLWSGSGHATHKLSINP